MYQPVTTSTAAQIAGRPESTIKFSADRGELPSFRLPSGIRVYERADVDRAREATTPAAPSSGTAMIAPVETVDITPTIASELADLLARILYAEIVEQRADASVGSATGPSCCSGEHAEKGREVGELVNA
jgi:hypothetical protein